MIATARLRALARLTTSAALALAIVSATPLGAPSHAAALSSSQPPYDHRWQVEGQLLGEAGATQKTIVSDAMKLEFASGRYTGTVAYVDVLGIYDGSQNQSQVSQIHLDLVGTPLQGGTAAGGTFSGTATLTTREASSLAQGASRDQLAARGGVTRTYDVAGHWAARLVGSNASGEVLFQSAIAQAGSGPTRSVAWFNRAGSDLADPLGASQTFEVSPTRAPAGEAPGPAPKGQTSGGAVPRSGSAGQAPLAPATPLSVLAYITRGYYGLAPAAAVPVSTEQVLAAKALRDAAPSDATTLPADAVSIDLDVAGAYLDAKNRAAGLLGDAGPIGSFADKGRSAVDALRSKDRAFSRLPIPTNPAAIADQLLAALKPEADSGVAGAQPLSVDVNAVRTARDPATLAELRAYLSAVEALAPAGSLTSMLAVGADSARNVAAAKVPRSGALAEAVLAAADSAQAPPSATAVAHFTREKPLDASVPTAGAVPPTTGFASHPVGGLVLPLRVLRSHAEQPLASPPALAWTASTGPQALAPSAWLAYRRADGTEFWLAGKGGPVALRDASLVGWAFSSPRAALVSAGDAGRVVAVYELP